MPMNLLHSLPRLLSNQRARLPLAALVLLLQRTPSTRLTTAAIELTAASPAGAILTTLFAAIGALGTVHSLAGATVLVATQPSPVNLTTASNLQLGFTVSNTINIASWKISGNVPPGLTFRAVEGGSTLNEPGTLQAPPSAGTDDGYGGTTGGMTTTTPILTGTPTQTGTYTMQLQAFADSTLNLPPSLTFPFTIVVAAAAQTATPPTFTTQPAPQTITAGTSLTLTAAAGGTPSPSYQWQKAGVAIAGATNATYTLTSAQVADAGTYTVVATNSAGTLTSNAITVAVIAVSSSDRAPSIARQPVTQTVATGSTVVFNAEVAASPAPAYQWRKNGANIPGATGATLVIAGAKSADAGTYAIVATNAAGSTTSTAASLQLSNAANFGHLINLSIRTSLTATEPTFTVGAVVGGPNTTGTKPLLVRAVGPSLAAFGITTALGDSKVEVFAGGTTVAANDNWSGDVALSTAFAQVGAFPLASATSKDAAVYNADFAARAYTIDVSAVGGSVGEVIAEVYDATATAAFGATTPRLVNVSVRKQINPGETLTAGFVVGGTTARTVLVRAIGPGLAAFGVPGTMPDPQLALFRGGEQVASNDNWGGDPQLTAAGGSVGAFGIADTQSKDAILLITLPPGSYTAEVKGTGAGGSALVEVYEVP